MRGEYEDWDFWLTALEKGWTAIKVPEPLFLYRKHDGGMLQIANFKREALYQKIVNRHPGLYEKLPHQIDYMTSKSYRFKN